MVVDAEVNKEQGRPLLGVNGEVRSKKDLTGPALLEMSGNRVYQDLNQSALIGVERLKSFARTIIALNCLDLMVKPNIIEFERLVRAYLAEEVAWDIVHQYAVEMEWQSATDFPLDLKEPLDALHVTFLAADGKDDPQFRADQTEILKLLNDLDKAEKERFIS